MAKFLCSACGKEGKFIYDPNWSEANRLVGLRPTLWVRGVTTITECLIGADQ